jgi:hypothetical protein
VKMSATGGGGAAAAAAAGQEEDKKPMDQSPHINLKVKGQVLYLSPIYNIYIYIYIW